MEGAHPLILERLTQTNMEKTPGYGTDHYCADAREKIRQACGCPEASVHFLVGGTQTNATVITSVLRPYEGVIAAESGHINQHEAGAVEAGGHKVLGLTFMPVPVGTTWWHRPWFISLILLNTGHSIHWRN